MPNYCNWRVRIYGLTGEQRERIGRWAKNWKLCEMIIPYPKDVKEDIKIKKEYDKEHERLFKAWQLSQEVANNLRKKYPYKDLWYNWCPENWGSKWDLCDCSIYPFDGWLELNFWTAWSPVLDVFKELSRKYKCAVEYDYNEWWMFFSGRARWEKWMLVYHNEYDDPYYWEWEKCVVCGSIYDWTNEEDWRDLDKHICYECRDYDFNY